MYQVLHPTEVLGVGENMLLPHVKGKQTKPINIHSVHVKYTEYLKLLHYSISLGMSSSNNPNTELQ